MLARICLLGLCPFINRVLHFESGHVRYRKPSPPITSGGRIRPSLTRFLRIEPDFIFLGRFGTFPLLCHVDMPNGHLAYVLPPVTYSHRFSTIFILPWFVCTRMDIVPCAGAMYNISDRNEPFSIPLWAVSIYLSRVTYRMVVRPMFSPPMTYSTCFSSIFTATWSV